MTMARGGTLQRENDPVFRGAGAAQTIHNAFFDRNFREDKP